MRILLCVVLALFCLPLDGLAQEQRTDSLYVSGEVDSGSASGGGGRAELVRAMSSRSSMVVGLGSMTLADEWWAYGRLGGFTKRRDITFVLVSDLGWGRRKDTSFPYVRSVGGVTIPVGWHLYGEAEAQYVRATQTGTRVFKVGALYAGVPRTTLQAAYHAAATNAARWRYASVRADVAMGRVRAMGGASLGSTPTPQPGVGAIELLAQTSQDLFAGVSVAARRVETICAFEMVRQSAGRLGRVLMTIRVPLVSHAAQPPDPRP